MNNIMGGLYTVSEWVMRFAVINLLWLLFNLPIVFSTGNLLLAGGQGEMILFATMTAVFAPFVFFPATAAMFASARDWIIENEGPSIFVSYVNYYKQNYKKSLLGGFIITGLWVILIVDFIFLKDFSMILAFVFIVFGLILYVITMNFFSVNAHYDMKLRVLLKNAFFITVGSPVLLFAVLFSGIVLLYVSIKGPLFLLLFFSGSLIAFLSFSAFYRLYLRLLS
ncbi:MAG: YesL family protein [Bacillota bacterium]